MNVDRRAIMLSLLLTPALALGQSSKKGQNSAHKEEKVHVKIMKEEDGQSTLIDTSFSSIEEAKAALKAITGKKMPLQDVEGDSQITLDFDFDEEGKKPFNQTRPFKKKQKNKIMILKDDWNTDEGFQALKELDALRIEMPELSELREMPQIKMFNHDWIINNGRGFSLSVTEPSKEELSKAGVKIGNTEDLIDDLSISGSGSKNRIKVSFEVIEPSNLAIKILNTDGKEIYSQAHSRYFGTFNNQIDFGRRIKGSYLIVISVNGKNIVRKINRDETTSY